MSAGAEQIGEVADVDLAGVTPWECAVCLLTDGPLCAYHEAWGAGWDACAAMVAQVATSERQGADAGPACWLCGGHETVPCSECDGTGDERGAWSAIDRCAACDGSGDAPCPECEPEPGGAA